MVSTALWLTLVLQGPCSGFAGTAIPDRFLLTGEQVQAFREVMDATSQVGVNAALPVSGSMGVRCIRMALAPLDLRVRPRLRWQPPVLLLAEAGSDGDPPLRFAGALPVQTHRALLAAAACRLDVRAMVMARVSRVDLHQVPGGEIAALALEDAVVEDLQGDAAQVAWVRRVESGPGPIGRCPGPGRAPSPPR